MDSVPCLSTPRLQAGPDTSATDGRVVWAPARSLWVGGMTIAAVLLAPFYLGTLVGMAGPLGMVRLHDTRDWAQRQAACHDLHAHRAHWLRDAWWQMHCRLDLARPPRFTPERRLDDRFLRTLEASWMAQQLPWAVRQPGDLAPRAGLRVTPRSPAIGPARPSIVAERPLANDASMAQI